MSWTGMPSVIAITEGIPVHDMLKTYWKAKDAGVRLIGPNCPGALSPGKANVGIIPAQFFDQGSIGVAYIAGFTAPPGKQMGHAGAIISGSSGTAEAKKKAFEAKGVRVGTSPSEAAAIAAEIVKG